MSRWSKSKYHFNPETMVYEKHKLSFVGRYGRLVLMVLLVGLTSWFIFYLFISIIKIEPPKTALLRNRSARWQAKMEIMESRLDSYEEVLTVIEDRDNDVYRSIFGLGDISREANVLYENVGNPRLDAARRKIENMSRRAYTQSKSLDDVSRQVQSVGDLVSHIPAVPPLCPDKRKVRISSSFGYRVDPVYGGGEYHRGQDFAAPRGYPVYATGDGVVKTVKHQFYGYGNMVVIDHGFGYLTRYAHLSFTNVTEGMKLSRGDKVGEIGSTGKSTGPHLHYEVEYMGRNVNPMNYMDYSMDIIEYKSMVDRRRRENESALRKNTSEIIRMTKH